MPKSEADDDDSCANYCLRRVVLIIQLMHPKVSTVDAAKKLLLTIAETGMNKSVFDPHKPAQASARCS
ncbi:hypothetical protein GOP47_0024937 [Adiantum capillus-veneris]|uniref:Uncharacterized protein n=1 Tax=Adiantum capillus-veneris TaxID=13818 RepID=A0A9D4Z4S4_ADICA|nr:hypothetical protein GOP47_0024937 [Adiantum capillus-veneris]